MLKQILESTNSKDLGNKLESVNYSMSELPDFFRDVTSNDDINDSDNFDDVSDYVQFSLDSQKITINTTTLLNNLKYTFCMYQNNIAFQV